MSTWSVLLVGATALHVGFQATVTVLGLSRAGPYRRRGMACRARAALAPYHPAGRRGVRRHAVGRCRLGACRPGSAGVWGAVLGTAFAFLVTATVATPAHGRLGAGRDTAVLDRLLRADRLRLAGAGLALAGAIAAALSR